MTRFALGMGVDVGQAAHADEPGGEAGSQAATWNPSAERPPPP